MRSKKPLISVVIPAYNEEKSLPACLDAFKNQTFKDFEVIVVNNNSTDRTVAIALSYGARIVNEKIQGMTPARERGFVAARCEIIARTDADTIVPPDWLFRIDEIFRQHPEAVAFTGGLTFPELSFVQDMLRLWHDFGYMKLTKKLRRHYPLVGSNYAVRKSAWKQVRVHRDDTKVHEDIDLSCHLSNLGTIIYRPDITTPYSVRRWRRRFFYTLFEYAFRYIHTLLIHDHRYIKYHKNYKRVVSKVKKQKAVLMIKEFRGRI